MALGTMVSCAEYYQDTTTYTGNAGSATNPYAVEDCYDFCAITSASAERYYNFVKDIDFNQHDTYKYGINDVTIIHESGTSAGQLHINGKGFDLRNVICMGYSTNNFIQATYGHVEISNVNFVNFVQVNCKSGSASSGLFSKGGLTTIKDCNFSIFLSNSNITFLCYQTIMVNCTLNISGTHSYYSNAGFHVMMLGAKGTTSGQSGCYKQNCFFNFENLVIQFPNSSSSIDVNIIAGVGNSGSTDRYASLINCYFRGAITILSTLASSDNIYLFSHSVHVTNCYYVVDTTFTNTIQQGESLKIAEHNNYATSFVATSIIKGFAIITSGYNYKLLTDEQCKDPEYLQSIGFPVINITNGGE